MIKALPLVILMLASVSSFAQKDSTDITGTWRWMIDKKKPGFTFTKDGWAYALEGNNRMGGPPTGDAEGKTFIAYKVGKIPGFYTLDLIKIKIINKKQVEQDRIKGLFVYLKDGRMKIALPEPGTPRPTKLVSGETMVFTKQ
jgi:hypothetical protein